MASRAAAERPEGQIVWSARFTLEAITAPWAGQARRTVRGVIPVMGAERLRNANGRLPASADPGSGSPSVPEPRKVADAVFTNSLTP